MKLPYIMQQCHTKIQILQNNYLHKMVNGGIINNIYFRR